MTRRPRPTPRERGYDEEYKRARRQLLEGNPPCTWCGQPATEADHYPPLKFGGTLHSMVPACKSCNSAHISERRWKSRRHTTRDW